MNNKKYKIIALFIAILFLASMGFIINQKIEYEKRILFWEIKYAKVMYETNWIPLWEYKKENK